MTSAARQPADSFLSALASERGQLPAPADTRKAAPLRVVQVPARDGAVELGTADIGGRVDVDLAKLTAGRLLIQGTSGAGKSWTLRRLLEQTAGAIQQIVVDPEGEFTEFAAAVGHYHVEGSRFDPAAIAKLASRIREHRLSIVLDLSQMEREEQMKSVAALFSTLVEAPREHWYPVLVAVDEAHLFAPFGGGFSEPTSVRKAAIAAMTDMMSRGRKRGLAGVLATQRLARLAKSVVSEAQNFLIGLNTLDLDIRRAAEMIGWDARRAFDRLPMLAPGDFVAVGSAFSRSPATLRVGPVQTRHVGEAPTIRPLPTFDPANAAQLLSLDELLSESREDEAARSSNALVPGLRAVRDFIRDPAFPAAGRIWGVLAPLAPEGASIAELAAYLEISAHDADAALVLLDGFGVLEFLGEGAARAVRLERGMRA